VTLHEMTHATVYLPGHTEWDESLATVVGVEGAARFFAARGEAAEAARLTEEARRREEDQQTFARFLEPVVERLEGLYASAALSRREKLRRRELVFADARKQFLTIFPPPPGHRPGSFVEEPLNNAVLLSYAVYQRTTPQHRALLAKLGGDLRAFVAVCKRAVEEEADPLAYLRALR
jgi:predicted aminopeptidase